jgi:HD superfamily phosphodiesterase
MKKFTHRTAKLTAEKYFKKRKDKEEQDFARVHTKAVVEIGVILAKKFKVDISAVEISGWVHDIGSTVERNNHAKHSLNLLEKEGFDVNPLIKDCILNHGTDGKPESKEAKILQMADKLSILSIPVLNILFKQKTISNSDIEFVNKMTIGAMAYLKEVSLNKKI